MDTFYLFYSRPDSSKFSATIVLPVFARSRFNYIVLDAQTQNGDEPVAIFLSSRGKVAFLARIPVETARYTFLRQLAVNDDK